MKSSLAQAAIFLPTLIWALPSSPPSSRGSVAKDITTVAGTTGLEHITIHFSAPCPGCFVGTDDGLELTLEIDAAEEECGARAPRLNGLPLSLPTADNNIAHGQISFISKPSNGLAEREINASWQSTCLQGEASILSVRFDDISGQNNVKDVSGFTTSFKQKGKPAVLRLQDRPITDISSQGICDQWLHPEDQSLEVVPLMANASTSVETQINSQFAEFERLKGEMEELRERVRENHLRIMSLLKQEFKACSSLSCLWQTAISKAPTIKKLVALHFSQNKHHVTGCGSDKGQKICSMEGQCDNLVEADPSESDQATEKVEKVHIDDVVSSSPSQEPPRLHDEIDEPSAYQEDAPFEDDHPHPPFEGDHPPPPPFEGDYPRPPFEGDHPPPPPFAGNHPHPPFGPPFGAPHRPPQGFPHPPPGHHGPPPFGHPGPHPGHPRFGWFRNGREHKFEALLGLIVVSLILMVIIAGLAFRLIRRSSWYRDPRRQADRAARREERRTRKLYRKAACKHKWTTWWKHYRRQCSNSDYEEKREMVLEQEGLLEDVMQNEIRTLRTTTDLVRDLVRAEEGRTRLNMCNHPHHAPYPHPSTEYNAGMGNNTFLPPPSYVAPPPRYEEELEGELTVVDGFRYTPSNTDDTPDSSIIDCSSRLSLETGRSTIATKDVQD